MEKTESNSSSNTGGARDAGLGKLLPKSISDKRWRRKEKRAKELDSGEGKLTRSSTSSMMLSSDDGAGSADERSIGGRSFGSFESGPEPESANGSARSSLRNNSRPPRSAQASPHPTLSGLTPTSPNPNPRSPTTASPINAEAWANSPVLLEPQINSAPRRKASQSPDRKSRASRSPATPTIASSDDKDAPAIVSTPPTPPDRVFDASPQSKRSSWRAPGTTAGIDGADAPRAKSGHTRSASASSVLTPSKLSNVLSNSLTPTAEEPNPGTNTGPTSSFFSSVFSAAQNAANNFSTNLQGSGFGIGGPKGRSTQGKQQDPTTPRIIEPDTKSEPETETMAPAAEMDQKESAVRTIGSGDLSLSQLGLEEPPSAITSPASARFIDGADTRARSESAPADTQISDFSMNEAGSRPRSLNENGPGTVTPPTEDFDDKFIGRTGSLRNSARMHRKRGSSVTTGGTSVTIGAPMSTIHSSPVSNPGANFSAQKLTGFAIASKKRNRDFHTIFKSVPDDDYLIEDYSCALQREILAHGRLYVSEGHLCFSSNILGWTTTLVMSFDEIVSVEKRSTALLFKNGLMISTLHAKHIFASFTSRDATYDLIVNIWKLGHPTLTSTLNGVRLEGTGGDKTEKLDVAPEGADGEAPAGSETEEESDEEDEEDEEFYDEEENDQVTQEPAGDSGSGEGEIGKAVTRKASSMMAPSGPGQAAAKDTPGPPGAADFPGPVGHSPTECGDAASHYERVVGDEIVQAPLGKVYSLMFGQASVTWLSKFLTDIIGATGLQMEDTKGLNLDNKTRSYTYIKPLNASIGPRSTKCITSETLDLLDFDKAANLTVTTQTPDVPSGNVFTVKTKYCLSWAENNATRVQVNCTIEWTGKSWLKGPIEKGANDGQTTYCKDLFTALRSAVSSRSRAGTGTNGAPKLRKKLKKGKALQSNGEGGSKSPPEAAKNQNWGLLEPVRPVLEPVTDLLKPLLTGNVMYGLLVGLLVSTWFGFGLTPRKNVSPYGPPFHIYGPDRLAAYEEMWRREDSELWEWLEERTGLERLSADALQKQKRSGDPRTTEEHMKEQRMGTKEVEEAIRVTEEKLRVLKGQMAKRASRGAET